MFVAPLTFCITCVDRLSGKNHICPAFYIFFDSSMTAKWHDTNLQQNWKNWKSNITCLSLFWQRKSDTINVVTYELCEWLGKSRKVHFGLGKYTRTHLWLHFYTFFFFLSYYRETENWKKVHHRWWKKRKPPPVAARSHHHHHHRRHGSSGRARRIFSLEQFGQ